MSTNWEKTAGNEGVLTVEVDVEKVNKGLDTAFKKVVKTLNVPGFRKGKLPRPLFEKRFGVEALYQDALDILLPEAYMNAIEETGIEPVDQPNIDIEQMEKGKPLIFKATVTVKPEVKLGSYKGIEVEQFDTNVTDEDIANELKNLQQQQAELVVKEEGEAENGDTVVIDFEGFVDDEAFEGGKAENYSLKLGSNSFIPGFEDQLIGIRAGEERDVNVTFPEEYHAAELAGKAALFKVKVHEIKAEELPELDDEFAKDVDEEVETLADLKEKVKNRLQENKNHEAEHHIRDTVIEKATENAEIDIPPVMITTEVDRMMKEFEQRLQMQGMNMDLYYQFSGQDEAALQEQMKAEAEKRVRTNLTLEAIGNAENISVSDEEVNVELEKMAEMYKMTPEQVKEALGTLEGIQKDVIIRKTVDFLIENSTTLEE
ncbi:trigger factor [Bacillus aquiflavi]|uniref:Trigger factor n=1 Tax=Bacillus aquiflavi TaxID=2672567 RepID=A0A6B3W1F4_9BACI|nr:trigger factor [Bacillus aquiflavi]MBA4537471.1 trigger factor [Bacillus aquiflavi]NEY81726.1 trigger factor [Bacillus aquiflavi]UAC47441.1 trigger factor [Bacillus aquiflavi]